MEISKICKQLVGLRGGMLNVKPGLGAGTTFEFRLKQAIANVSEPEGSSVEPAASAELPSNSCSSSAVSDTGAEILAILAVDDDKINLIALKSMLGSDYEIISVMSCRKRCNN